MSSRTWIRWSPSGSTSSRGSSMDATAPPITRCSKSSWRRSKAPRRRWRARREWGRRPRSCSGCSNAAITSSPRETSTARRRRSSPTRGGGSGSRPISSMPPMRGRFSRRSGRIRGRSSSRRSRTRSFGSSTCPPSPGSFAGVASSSSSTPRWRPPLSSGPSSTAQTSSSTASPSSSPDMATSPGDWCSAGRRRWHGSATP